VTVRINFEGLNELRDGLSHLTQELTDKASAIVSATAQQVDLEVQANYPSRTGNLKRGVSFKVERSGVSTRGVVRSAAPHAHLIENYTGNRRETRSGANRGVMPASPIDERVGPRASRARHRMYDQLIEIVKEAGPFEVSKT
jgi:hypothetical protein